MKLYFKQTSPTHVDIVADSDLDGKHTEKVIGHIFTPSGSGHDTLNSIQVCGLVDAYDLWGCSVFKTFKTHPNGIEYEKRKKPGDLISAAPLMDIIDTASPEGKAQIAQVIEHNKAAWARFNDQDNRIRIHCKDIQLKFPYPQESFTDELHGDGFFDRDMCWGCFNNPCTCDHQGGNFAHRNPYDVKRSQDLILSKVKKPEVVRVTDNATIDKGIIMKDQTAETNEVVKP